ncbi:MAG: hypothetical protein CMH46_03160 [Muricauda sp.]|nr:MULTISPECIES: hypothetical protein [unclassified Allomuricauda]MAU14520.1 hypothetical protein [Allomuricauda sp.]|tara:strand:+ start:500 stop:898 length:399 start_codon:yes stop_codon:yes gene_type:complete
MKRSTYLFKKLVFITGAFNFPIGIGLIAQSLITVNPETLIIQTVLGTFLLFAGASLVWASRDIQTRAPIIVWNALVRAVGFGSVLLTYSIGEIPTTFIPIAAMDLVLAFVYIIGSVKATEIAFSKLMIGKTN